MSADLVQQQVSLEGLKHVSMIFSETQCNHLKVL